MCGEATTENEAAMFDLRRREFILTLVAATAAPPLVARAQPAKAPRVGVLLPSSPDPEVFLRGFRDSLQALGYIDGKNIRLEARSAEGRSALLREKAGELVRLKVDVIVTSLTPTAQAAKQATRDIPIVMAPAGDPVGTGLVASLAQPGGNVTGMSGAAAEIAGKSLELIREVVPSARRVAVLANETDPFSVLLLAQIATGAHSLGIEIEPVMSRPAASLDPAFDLMSSKNVNAVFLQGSLLRKDAFDLAIRHRLPLFSSNRLIALSGGLMSYAASNAEVYSEAARYVDNILKGRKPADLPVSQPTKFELIINLKTAKALGLTIPPTLLARADEVIE
jgi:putative ABC transport system substrate-binding protein